MGLRIVGALSAGYAAYGLAIGIGIPRWINSPTAQVPADATDIGVLVAIAALCLFAQRKDQP